MKVSSQRFAIVNEGLVTSVGLSAPAACAAIRAAITNHSETTFTATGSESILGAQVPLAKPWRGRTKLVQMLQAAVKECLSPLGPIKLKTIPILLCVAERERPGRVEGLDDELLQELENELSIEFHPQYSSVIPEGRVGFAFGLAEARRLLFDHSVSHVLVAAADSLLIGPTLAAYASGERLLTRQNSNGFVPGEAAGAVLVARDEHHGHRLVCEGLGFGVETATISSESPLRADGLTQAMKLALAEAGLELRDLDFRVTDNSGEHYYFKEAALALGRNLRGRQEQVGIWHPADCIGEVGAAIGVVMLAVASMACRKAYAPGRTLLCHAGSDAGHRAAAVFRYRGDE